MVFLCIILTKNLRILSASQFYSFKNSSVNTAQKRSKTGVLRGFLALFQAILAKKQYCVTAPQLSGFVLYILNLL